MNKKDRKIKDLQARLDVMHAEYDDERTRVARLEEQLDDVEWMMSSQARLVPRAVLNLAREIWLSYRRRRMTATTSTAVLTMPTASAEQLAFMRAARIIEQYSE